jgi:hypothetical protein
MHHPKLDLIKAFALAVGILIVLNLFFNIGVRTFYPAPEFDDFCSEDLQQRYEDRESCEEVGGKWMEQGFTAGHMSRPIAVPLDKEFVEYCDPYNDCKEEHNTARELYERNVFLILIIAGFLALGIGLHMSAVAAVSSGLIWGGVLSLLIGTMRYWSGMQDYLRFIILGIVLVVLVWLGYRKMKR